MLLRSCGSALALACVLLSAGSAVAETTLIEGYVFNKKSLRPLGGATVQLVDPLGFGPAVSQITDPHGFYALEVEGAGRFTWLSVLCKDPRDGEPVPTQLQSLRPRPGVMQRNLYVPGRKALNRCQPPTLPIP